MGLVNCPRLGSLALPHHFGQGKNKREVAGIGDCFWVAVDSYKLQKPDMQMRTLLPTAATILAAFTLTVDVPAQTSTAKLTLEQSINGLSNWQRVPLTAEMLNNGDIDLTAVSSNAFYRMRIAVLPPATNNMITVQGGILPQSSSSWLPRTAVNSFQIGKYEVTWEEWIRVRTWAVANGYNDLANVGLRSAGNHPVRAVNWYDVVKWCNAMSEMEGLTPVYMTGGAVYRTGGFGWNGSGAVTNRSANGYRLPTEPEWEWTARGGVKSQGFAHSGSNDSNSVAWHYGNSTNGVLDLDNTRCDRPVGTKAPNELGLHDMSGNVWEWCEDVGFVTYTRRLRGISFSNMADRSTVVGDGSVNESSPDARIGAFGFRLARNAP